MDHLIVLMIASSSVSALGSPFPLRILFKNYCGEERLLL